MLISPAYAQAQGQQPDPLISFLPLLVIFAIFYFMIIRPQIKRAKEQKKMQEALQKGDEVVTSSGQVGKVIKLTDQYATVEIAQDVQTVFQRGAIQTVLPKGTLKDL